MFTDGGKPGGYARSFTAPVRPMAKNLGHGERNHTHLDTAQWEGKIRSSWKIPREDTHCSLAFCEVRAYFSSSTKHTLLDKAHFVFLGSCHMHFIQKIKVDRSAS